MWCVYGYKADEVSIATFANFANFGRGKYFWKNSYTISFLGGYTLVDLSGGHLELREMRAVYESVCLRVTKYQVYHW